MKTITLLLLLLVATKPKAQDVSWSGSYLSGVCTGVRDQVLFHPVALFNQYSRLNRQWWDSRISYMNKYSESPALVAFSDANHFFAGAALTLNCVAVAFSFGDMPKHGKAWWLIKRSLINYVFNRAGFGTSYYLLFKNK